MMLLRKRFQWRCKQNDGIKTAVQIIESKPMDYTAVFE